MNAEIIKAMNRKPKEVSKFRKWWNKNGYKVMRVILFPVWFCMIAKEKIEKYLNSRNKWSEERANEILQYYIPRRSRWDAESKELYFFDNGYGWNNANRYLKRRDRRFWKLHIGWFGGKISDYLIKEFELEGFTKEVLNDCSDWTEIVFKLGVDNSTPM